MEQQINKQGIKSSYLSLILPSSGAGIIHSIFSASFNIEIDKQLIHITSSKHQLSCFGLNVKGSVVQEIIEKGCVGDIIYIQENLLRIYTRQKVFTIPLGELAEINLRIEQKTWDIDRLRNNETIQILESLDYSKAGLHDGGHYDFLNKLMSQSDFNRESIHELMNRFVGRGIGLTPSGDDFIIGYLMVQCAFNHPMFIRIRNEFENKITYFSTTDISKQYYRCILKGYASSYFVKLLNNISNSNPRNSSHTVVGKILHHGHTSGIDTLFGVYISLGNLINKENDR